MANAAGKDRRERRGRGPKAAAVIAALAAAVAALLLIRTCGTAPEPTPAPSMPPDTVAGRATGGETLVDTTADTAVAEDTAAPVDTAEPAVRQPRSFEAPPPRPDTVAPVDTVAEAGADTVDTALASAEEDTVRSPCAGDTVAPWIYPDPSGGLHRGPVEVAFKADEDVSVEWRFESEERWQRYDGGVVDVVVTQTLHYRGCDSCGNCMEPRSKFYEIKPLETTRFCPEGMEYVEIGATRFCIDRYEWPNRKGVEPTAFINIYAAMDSCYVAGKRLCTTEEWSLACGGAYGWEYPYGGRYEPNACVTRDTVVRKSGSKPECRGYFAVFDMAGNLAEWTATRSRENPRFYNVMGGFWQSGPQSTCGGKRYSYFPDNRHNPVGFRCCADAGGDGDDG
jgi:hypothetical protein